VLNENIVGAALVRLLNVQAREVGRFDGINERARAISMKILRRFAAVMPLTTLLIHLAVFTILSLGGRLVMAGQMSLGEFSAFNAYLVVVVFPMIVIGSASPMIGQARASYARISSVLDAPPPADSGGAMAALSGAIEVRKLTIVHGERRALADVSFRIAPATRTAVAGPTAAGKSQLLHLMTGLLRPSFGEVLYDGRAIDDYDRHSFYAQIGLVFQDSQLFNATLRENITFNADVSEARLALAIDTAELRPLIAGLPRGLETVVSERGSSLSGGQKQRIMLARALVLVPKILFLDDFTARVDLATEARILANIQRNFPGMTLISITQKLKPVEGYDQIILLMDGVMLGAGKHDELLRSNPEYRQILLSQQDVVLHQVA
jgi:ATP-binding cassette subfamily B protein